MQERAFGYAGFSGLSRRARIPIRSAGSSMRATHRRSTATSPCISPRRWTPESLIGRFLAAAFTREVHPRAALRRAAGHLRGPAYTTLRFFLKTGGNGGVASEPAVRGRGIRRLSSTHNGRSLQSGATTRDAPLSGHWMRAKIKPPCEKGARAIRKRGSPLPPRWAL